MATKLAVYSAKPYDKLYLKSGEGVEVGGAVGGASAGEEEGVGAGGDLFGEAKTWEWMYGGGPPSVPGVNASGDRAAGDTVVRRRAAPIARSRLCPFCETPIRPDGTGSVCANGHVFGEDIRPFPKPPNPKRKTTNINTTKRHGIALTSHPENCAATGIPITAPDISNTCAVCGSKCLKPAELLALAAEYDDSSEDKDGDFRAVVCEISHELCGGCGGKFIN